MNTKCAACESSYLIEASRNFYQLPCRHYLCENCMPEIDAACAFTCGGPWECIDPRECIEINRVTYADFIRDICALIELLLLWGESHDFDEDRRVSEL